MFSRNNTFIFSFLLLLSIGVAACKNEKTNTPDPNHASSTTLAGRWIAMDFCARADQYGSVLGAMNHAHAPYAYAFEFNANSLDSVICCNGFEEPYKLPVQIKVDTIEIKNAVQGKSIFLVYDPTAKELVLYNSTAGRTDIDRFTSTKFNGANGHIDFLAALNTALFDGTFNGLRKGSPDGVKFTSTGAITNLPGFEKYELCTAGDCFVGDDKMDIITLKSAKDTEFGTMFSFKYGGNNDTLTLYNLKDLNPDDKGGYVTAGIAYQWLRKKNPLFQPKKK